MLVMQRRTPSRVASRLPQRSSNVAATSVEISDSSEDDKSYGVRSAGSRQSHHGLSGRGGTGSSSAHSSKHADPSSSELSDSDDAARPNRGGRQALVYKTPSRAVASRAVRHGGSVSRPTTAGMNRGLGGAGAGDDVEMIEQALGRQQHGLVRAGNNAVSRAQNAARNHNQQLSGSEISASSDEDHRVPQSVARASMAAVRRSQATARAQSAMDESDDDVLSDDTFHTPARQAPRSALKLHKLTHTPAQGSSAAYAKPTAVKSALRQLPHHSNDARGAHSPDHTTRGSPVLNPLSDRHAGASGEGGASRAGAGGLQPLGLHNVGGGSRSGHGVASAWSAQGSQAQGGGAKQHGGKLVGLPARAAQDAVRFCEVRVWCIVATSHVC